MSIIECPVECPICMDEINGGTNIITTECGHLFHGKCLMQNVAHNGFDCPCCRSKLAEIPEDDDDDDDEYDDDDDYSHIISESNALTSFRMFQQRLNGEEVEEELEHEEEDDEEDEDEEEENQYPDSAYMSRKIAERGITYEDLVKQIMFVIHPSRIGNVYRYERRSSEIYGQFRAIISQYAPEEV